MKTYIFMMLAAFVLASCGKEISKPSSPVTKESSRAANGNNKSGVTLGDMHNWICDEVYVQRLDDYWDDGKITSAELQDIRDAAFERLHTEGVDTTGATNTVVPSWALETASQSSIRNIIKDEIDDYVQAEGLSNEMHDSLYVMMDDWYTPSTDIAGCNDWMKDTFKTKTWTDSDDAAFAVTIYDVYIHSHNLWTSYPGWEEGSDVIVVDAVIGGMFAVACGPCGVFIGGLMSLGQNEDWW